MNEKASAEAFPVSNSDTMTDAEVNWLPDARFAWHLLKESTSEDEDYRGIAVVPLACQLAGGGAAAVILSQLVYWNRASQADNFARISWRHCNPLTFRLKEEDKYPPGRAPWPASREEIAEQTGLTRDQVKHAIDKLRRRKMVKTTNTPGLRHVLRLSKKGFMQLGGKDQFSAHKWKGYLVVAEVVRRLGPNPALVFCETLRWWLPEQRMVRDPRKDVAQPKLRIMRKNHFWRAISRSELARETGLSVDQSRRALEKLIQQGLLIARLDRFRANNVIHVRPDTKKCSEALIGPWHGDH